MRYQFPKVRPQFPEVKLYRLLNASYFTQGSYFIKFSVNMLYQKHITMGPLGGKPLMHMVKKTPM